MKIKSHPLGQNGVVPHNRSGGGFNFYPFFSIFTFKKKINGQNNIVFGWVDVVALEFKTV
jgi:hypothetical protein